MSLALDALEAALHLLLPRTCAHCGEDLPRGERGPLCERCFVSLDWIRPPCCGRCGLPEAAAALCRACRGRRFACEAIRAPLLYGPQARSLVVALKYGGRRKLAQPLGGWMAKSLPALEGKLDALVPVPLHPARLRSRGYNQSLLLAERVAAGSGLPVWPALERLRATRPQAELGRQERLGNLKGAYGARLPVRGKSLLLIDDVGTTGTTLEECAAALMAAGAERVRGLVLARQPL